MLSYALNSWERVSGHPSGYIYFCFRQNSISKLEADDCKEKKDVFRVTQLKARSDREPDNDRGNRSIKMAGRKNNSTLSVWGHSV